MESSHWLQDTVLFAQAQLVGQNHHAPETRSLFPAGQANEGRVRICRPAAVARTTLSRRAASAAPIHAAGSNGSPVSPHGLFLWRVPISSTPPNPPTRCLEQQQLQQPAGVFASSLADGVSACVPDSLQSGGRHFACLKIW
ncbi:hypothetical protein FDECE_15135 [Fusarium decemcellulare]|nr:hypothetical protein FDECE_15135 [Fusarium decemcellulare]